ncbi:hypothetical protein ACMWQU_26530, partial [Escherichia coli]
MNPEPQALAAMLQSSPAQAFQAVPDRHGSNLYTTDSQLQPLLALYLPPEVNAHLQPHLERMGALAGR